MATQEVRVKNIGLRGVTVADTKVSYIDGQNGILIYRGYRIEDLAANSTFMETAYLLLFESLPTQKQLEEFTEQVVKARDVPDYLYESLKHWPKNARPMDVLQASVPLLGMADPDLFDESRDAEVRKSIRLIACLPVVMAAWHRIRNGLEPLKSDDSLSHAANFLWLLNGEKPLEEVARDLDTCLVLHADHTFNASTFACREVVSTQAHMYAGVAAGVGALSGALHGGANERVMKMLLELEGEEDIPGWVRGRLDRGEKVMGIGHAVYKTMDPRAKILKEMSFRIGEATGKKKWPERSAIIEKTAVAELEKKGKTELKPNVDFYSASVYYMMGIPVDFMTCIFAFSRTAGWCSHIIEEKLGEAQEKPALYRPKAEYVGDYCGPAECKYEPMDERA
jgi:citrate synthase